MEIIISNTRVKVQSLPIVVKGNQSLNSLSGADITGSAGYLSIWTLSACTGLRRVTGINYVPGFYTVASQKTTRIYKINKVTHAISLILEYTATDAELNVPKHLDVDVELGENEYLGIAGAMYYALTGGSSFLYRNDLEELTDNQTVNLWYNIEGYE